LNIKDSAKILETLIPYFYRTSRGEKAEFCKKYKLTPTQLDVLTTLKWKRMNLSQLSEATLLDSSTLVGIVDRLSKREIIHKKVSHKDRRQNILSLSKNGNKLIESIPDFISPTLMFVLEELDKEEREDFIRIFRKILKKMKLTELLPSRLNNNGIRPVLTVNNPRIKTSTVL